MALFQAIEANRLVVAGRTERDVEQDIYALAQERFGVEKHWHKRIVRSGANTLTTAGEFDYVKGRLNADQADELAVGSPFDYETSTLLLLANDIAEPQQRLEYQKAIERTLVSLCTATRGRAPAACTWR